MWRRRCASSCAPFPRSTCRSTCTTATVNLQEDGYDVAIRTGELADSSLIAKRLAPDRHVIVASPAYIARAGRPLKPEDLARHDCLMLGECRQWSFSKGGAESAVRVSGPLRSNNGELLARAAVEGLGLIRASELEVACEQRTGKLVQVLGEYEVATNAALWALYPSAKHVLPRMRALLDFLADWFRDAGNGGRVGDGRDPCRGGGRGDQRRRARQGAAARRLSHRISWRLASWPVGRACA